MLVYHRNIAKAIEQRAPLSLKEDYDNVGFIIGRADDICTGVLIGFDCTEELVYQAIKKKCNLIVTHHPLIFKGLKQIDDIHFPNPVIRQLIKNDITHYAAHTNIDNVISGVNVSFVEAFNLQQVTPLIPKTDMVRKLIFYVPKEDAQRVRESLFAIGAGRVGNYSCCSFNTYGEGSYKPNQGTRPYLGEIDKLHIEEEVRVEMIFPQWLQQKVVQTLLENHPYEEVAYDIFQIDNYSKQWGSGVIGHLESDMSENDLLRKLKTTYQTSCIRHTKLKDKAICRLAFCGGSGASFIKDAIRLKADVYITGDLKYHDFVDFSKSGLLLVDIGHWESEQHALEFLHQTIRIKFPKFAVHKGEGGVSPISYFY